MTKNAWYTACGQRLVEGGILLITDAEGMEFLQWCLPRLGLHWPEFRKIRRRVYKRLKRRLHELGLPSINAYRSYLAEHVEEWAELSSLCWMPITRFYRDRRVFQHLETEILPQLVEHIINDQKNELSCWSAGCASGEEPLSLVILWRHRLAGRYPAVELHVVATDIDPLAIQRAQRGCYHWSSMKELPAEWRAEAFIGSSAELWVKHEYLSAVTFHVQNLRDSVPDGIFHLILCRNLAFTYFDETCQRETLRRLTDKLAPGGALIIGNGESLPEGRWAIEPWSLPLGIYRKTSVAKENQ